MYARPEPRVSGGRDRSRSRLAVDRVACTGHGVCAQLLKQVRLDEWGYPIVESEPVDPDEAAPALTLCPSRALFLTPQR